MEYKELSMGKRTKSTPQIEKNEYYLMRDVTDKRTELEHSVVIVKGKNAKWFAPTEKEEKKDEVLNKK